MAYCYLVPIDQVGQSRGPRYLRCKRWAGLDVRWSLHEFGEHPIGVVLTEAPIRNAPEAVEISCDWTQHLRDRIGGMLRAGGIEPGWVMQAADWRAGWQRLAGLALAHQAQGRDAPDIWLGRDIYSGFTVLRHLDERRYAEEQAARQARVVEELRVRWSIEKPRFDWRAALKQAALMPLWLMMGALPATDAFTGSNDTHLATYSASWTINQGQFDIQTNAIAPDAILALSGAHWNADTFNNDQYAQGTMLHVTSYVYMGVAVRAHASNATYYSFFGDSADGCYLERISGSTETEKGSKGGTFAANDIIYLQISSTTLTPKKNGSSTGTPGAQTDATYTSGYAGLSGFDNAEMVRLDGWEGGNLGETATAVPVFMNQYRQRRN
jgi:hypothetical protein